MNNTQLVQHLYAAFGRGDLNAVLDACADDVDWRCHVPASVPYGGRFKGKDGAKEFFGRLLANVSLTSFQPRTFLADGETVVVLGRDEGKVVSNGRPYGNDWVQVFVVRGGKIARFDEYTETAPLEAAFRPSAG